ncbi:acyltransferase [Indiicoccus explosivorum]|uniref:acyltransferase n=1 Tax=Indiicoccus explosivorum TaxID=1917864 RepID=UPI001F4EF37F|nr:DapH/DapD/GlmU-related protein [Indiicoccus explosivorum]
MINNTMRNILRTFSILVIVFYKAFYKYIMMPMKKSMFAECGKNVYIGRRSTFIYNNIHLGNNISIGSDANFICGLAKIIIKDKVMFGPHVFIITGSHRMDVIGEYMIDIKDKLPENDLDVVIEEDVWVGANVIILKGVTIGRGSVIAAGSIVTKNVEPYSIYAGVPARKIKERFSEEEISEHEKLMAIN